jgi:hypothetical protein
MWSPILALLAITPLVDGKPAPTPDKIAAQTDNVHKLGRRLPPQLTRCALPELETRATNTTYRYRTNATEREFRNAILSSPGTRRDAARLGVHRRRC